MRFDNVEGSKVCSFICGDSACNGTCCMQQVLGRCYSITEAWNNTPESPQNFARHEMAYRSRRTNNGGSEQNRHIFSWDGGVI